MNKYAVLAAVNDNQQGRKLEMAWDARRLYEALLMFGWNRKDIRLLTGKKSKMANVYEVFNWLKQVEGEDSTIVIYIGGHGNQSGVRLADFFFNYAMMNDCFGELKSGKQLVAVNCCYSGGILPHIERANRIALSSSSANTVPTEGHYRHMTWFGEHFIEDGLKKGLSVQDSWYEKLMIDNYKSPFYL